MRLFTVDTNTIRKNLLRSMNSEPVVMGRPGPPPRVQELHMRKWLEQLLLSSLTPYKHDIVEEVKPVRTPVAILGSLGVCIYVPASRHWLISYSPVHLN